MIWHVVRLDFTNVGESVRSEIEQELAGLADLDVVAWLRVGRDTDQPTITGLITGFETAEDLDTYREHPDHLPVVRRIRDMGVQATRFDIATDDDVNALP